MNQTLNKLRPPVRRAVLSAFVAGVLVHQFALVNVLHNIDDIGQLPYGYGTGMMSGRWLLTMLGDLVQALGGGYNLHYVNGLLYLALVAAAAGVAVSIFRVENPGAAMGMGALFAVFPPVAAVLLFRFTSVYYGLSFLLAVLAVWVLERWRWGLPVSALLIACSLGIYQGYVPVTISLFVVRLLQQALQGKTAFKSLVARGFYDCFALVLGLGLYYLLLNGSLALYGVSLSDYNGMNQMGKLSLGELPGLVYQAFYFFCMMPLKDYCGLANMALLKADYLLLAALTAGMLVWLLWKQVRKPFLIAFALLMCLVLPVAVNFVVIMSPDAWIYTLMLYAFVLVPCVPLLMYECLPEGKGKPLLGKALGVVLAVMIFCYSYSTNINYTATYYSNRQVENYVTSLVAQIRMADGFTSEKKWAFLGEPEDPLLRSVFDYEMTYGGTFTTDRTLEGYSRVFWIWHYLGYFPPPALEEEIRELEQLDQVQQMPCWPDQGSIQVIDDTVVIKFENP